MSAFALRDGRRAFGIFGTHKPHSMNWPLTIRNCTMQASYPIADTVTDTMVNATTWKSIWTKRGKIVEREFETIAPNGKVFREIDQGRDEKGRKFKNHLVFERP
jgi:hypothetical protein